MTYGYEISLGIRGANAARSIHVGGRATAADLPAGPQLSAAAQLSGSVQLSAADGTELPGAPELPGATELPGAASQVNRPC